MTDPDRDFRPVERREKRHFEAPPWEQTPAGQRGTPGPVAAPIDEENANADALKAVRELVIEPGQPHSAAAPDEIDEALVDEMLAGLSAEEPPAGTGYWKIGVGIGVGTVVLGVVFLVWGTVALVAAGRSGATGMLGASVLLLFGTGFVVGGLYVVVKNLRQQGVL